MKTLREADPSALAGTAILRLDFNTEDAWRMEASLETIKFLIDKAEKIVILSHKGRPDGTDPKFSLRNDSEVLKKLLDREIDFFSEFNFADIKQEISESPKGSMFVLENLRFLPGEASNDPSLAKDLASLGDFYVNDAFAVSHRENASVVALPKLLPSYAGFELEKEIQNLTKIMGSPEQPLVFILGGGKAEEKLEMVKFLYDKIGTALIGGVPANTLLKIKGVETEDSVIAKEPEKFKEFLNMDKLILPDDWIMEDGKILDIGPKTIENFRYHIRGAKTIVWNGPLGFIENENFMKGTLAIAEEVTNSKAFTLAGGGETVMFLKQFALDKKVTFISTGGGAMLDFLAGKELPGIKALHD